VLFYSGYAYYLYSNQQFTTLKWKQADGYSEREQMAENFLKKQDTRGMTLDQLKELLGEPDYGLYVWMYNLGVNGPPPPERQGTQVYYQHPQLYVYFEGLRVRDVRVLLVDGLKEDLKFDSDAWKSSRPTDRLRMAQNLISSETLKSHDKDEVRQTLGDPDEERKYQQVEYALGYRMIDLVTLTFDFDADGKISDARIIEH
jgi:hypothetical protein